MLKCLPRRHNERLIVQRSCRSPYGGCFYAKSVVQFESLDGNGPHMIHSRWSLRLSRKRSRNNLNHIFSNKFHSANSVGTSYFSPIIASRVSDTDTHVPVDCCVIMAEQSLRSPGNGALLWPLVNHASERYCGRTFTNFGPQSGCSSRTGFSGTVLPSGVQVAGTRSGVYILAGVCKLDKDFHAIVKFVP